MLLGIDIGTSACKAVLFSEEGETLFSASRSYPVYYPYPGWAEQDADDWWRAVCSCISELLANPGCDAAHISAVGVDGQSWSAIAVDAAGNCIDRTPIWMDTRADKLCARVNDSIGAEAIYRIAGNTLQPPYSTPKILWLKEKEPAAYARTTFFLQSNSYIVFRLTGVFSQDLSQGYGLHFFDIRKRCYDTVLARELGVDPAKIPPLYACTDVVGRVTEEASRLCGLHAGTPVVAGGLDAACGTLGAGVTECGQTQEQGGQAGGMSICLDSAKTHRRLICSPHVIPDRWLLQGGTVGGGGLLRWLRDTIFPEMSFDALTAMAAEAPVGADGLLFLPYMAGERSPIWDPHAKGVFYGLDYRKTKAHLIRAVLESAAYTLEHNLITAREADARIDRLYAVGGASNSRLWTQIKADVTGLPIRVCVSDEATALGAAMLAGIGTGVYRDAADAVKRTVRQTREHTPDNDAHVKYQERMERFLLLSETATSLFGRI